jgi:hypothetical protein
MAVIFGNGDGTFSAPTSFSNSGTGGNFIASEDFNGDNLADLYVSSNGVGASIFLNDGSGGFSLKQQLISGNAYQRPGIEDFNNDGIFDLSIGRSGGGEMHVYLGNVDGSFGNRQILDKISGGGNVYSSAAGDLNGGWFLRRHRCGLHQWSYGHFSRQRRWFV